MNFSSYVSLLSAASSLLLAWALPLPAAGQTPQARPADAKTAPQTNVIDVTQFGAIADDGLDDAAAINAAIEYSQTAESKSKVVYLPSGIFDLKDTIHLGKGDRYSRACH